MPENAAHSPAIAPDALQPALDLQRTLLRRGALLVALLLLGLGLWSGQALGRAERVALPATQSLRLLSALPDQGRGNVGVATYGGFQKAAWYAESALIALRALAGRRTAEGWEVVDLIERGSTQRVVAQQLGITQAAVSQRLTAAGHDELNRLAGLATITLAAAMAWSQ